MENKQPIAAIRGHIEDRRTHEIIQGATIYLKSDKMNTVFSDNCGMFELAWRIPPTNLKGEILVVTCPGYTSCLHPLEDCSHALASESSLPPNEHIIITLQKKIVYTELPDIDLVYQTLAGDSRAFAPLTDRYRDAIYNLLFKMVHNSEDTLDLTLLAFSKAFQSLHRYNEEYAFSTWLYRIAINNCIDFVRRKKLPISPLDSSIEDDEGNTVAPQIASVDLTPEENLERTQRILFAKELIGKLSPKYRPLIEMFYLQEKSYEEIAQQLNLPLGTVKAQLFRAKEMMTKFTQPSVFKEI